ncbi:MAG: FliH/SctL family protein [Pseudomonadota bacterium]
MNPTTSPAARYLFDLDFDAEARKRDEQEAEPTISLYEHEAHMAALERKVRQEAHDAGREEALAEGSRAVAEETQRLTGIVSTLLTRLDAEIAEREARAVTLALAAAKKLARRLMEKEPVGEVEELFRACLAPMFDASHLVIRMPEAHLETVRERLEAAAQVQGFEGRLVYIGDEDMAPGDAQIEWADGGLARSQRELEAAIDQLVTDYFDRNVNQSQAMPSDAPSRQHGDDL